MASKKKKQNTRSSAIEGEVFDVKIALRRFIQLRRRHSSDPFIIDSRDIGVYFDGKVIHFDEKGASSHGSFKKGTSVRASIEKDALFDVSIPLSIERVVRVSSVRHRSSEAEEEESLSLEESEELEVLLTQTLHILRGCNEVARRISASLDRVSDKTEDVSVAYRELLTP